MDDAEFKYLTQPRDRRGEDPSALSLEIVDAGEQLAFHLHCVWCDEANRFSPQKYANYKLCAKIEIKPEPLREVLRGFPLCLLDDAKMARVAKLAEEDREVWNYIKKWFLDGMTGDPKPHSVPRELTEVVRQMAGDNKPKSRSKPPYVGISDEVIHDAATQLYKRYGYAPYSELCLEVLHKATGLSADTIREKLTDAGKGTAKKSYRKKKTKKKT